MLGTLRLVLWDVGAVFLRIRIAQGTLSKDGEFKERNYIWAVSFSEPRRCDKRFAETSQALNPPSTCCDPEP